MPSTKQNTHCPRLLQLRSRLHVVKVYAAPVSDVSAAALLAVHVRDWAGAPRVIQEVTDGLVSLGRLQKDSKDSTLTLHLFHIFNAKLSSNNPIVIVFLQNGILYIPFDLFHTLQSSPSPRSSSQCSASFSPPTPTERHNILERIKRSMPFQFAKFHTYIFLLNLVQSFSSITIVCSHLPITHVIAK